MNRHNFMENDKMTEIDMQLSLREAKNMVEAEKLEFVPQEPSKPSQFIKVLKLVRSVSKDWYRYGYSDGVKASSVPRDTKEINFTEAERVVMITAIGNIMNDDDISDDFTRVAVSLINRFTAMALK